MAAFVYMLRCKDGSLYTGWTNDVAHRFAMHCAGKGAKYTRGRGPLELVYTEELADKESALRRECAIKRLARSAKLALATAWLQSKMRGRMMNLGGYVNARQSKMV